MFPTETETPTVVTPSPAEARVASLERELGEARESERYWAGLAKSGAPKTEPEPEPTEEEENSEFYDASADASAIEGDTPEKTIDDFAAEGVKALSKRGFITAKDAQKIAVDTAVRVTNTLINRTTTKLSTDQKITGEFPELLDQNSELFKETAKRYQRAVAMDPKAKNTPAALYLAAEGARDSMRAKGRRADPDDEPEADRRTRADSQDARPRGRATADDPDDMLTGNQREIVRAMGITEKEFRESQKSQATRPVKR